jgi:putative FmdB family regulatory protein
MIQDREGTAARVQFSIHNPQPESFKPHLPMPTYDYKCSACGHTFDELQSFSEPPLTKCPQCKKNKLERLFGGGGAVIFKGAGFYETDYRRAGESAGKSESENGKNETKETKAETPANGAAKSETKSEAKSETKGGSGGAKKKDK